MATIRERLAVERPILALAMVLAVFVLTTAILVPFGLLDVGLSGSLGESVFALVFVVVPGLAGTLCGWNRLGVPAAAGCGLAPGVAFFLVVTVGAALAVGSFGGGDSPAGPLALVLTAPGLLAAGLGFALAITARRIGD